MDTSRVWLNLNTHLVDKFFRLYFWIFDRATCKLMAIRTQSLEGKFSKNNNSTQTSRHEMDLRCLCLANQILDLPIKKTKHRIWFHAASMELESLWPIIENFENASQPVEIIVSVFSPSALVPLVKHTDNLQKVLKNVNIIKVGFSPSERNWRLAIKDSQVDAFVTVRYEAWPGLWHALRTSKIPLFLVCAQWRPSLKWLKRLFSILSLNIPDLYLFPLDLDSKTELENNFSEVKSNQVLSDPRWDRVKSRIQKGSLRARDLLKQVSTESGYGVLGSVWLSDWPIIKSGLLGLKGLVFLVPHDVTTKNIERFKGLLKNEGYVYGEDFIESTASLESLRRALGAQDSRLKYVIVNETGFLVELYEKSSWAYIGGGFGDGIHSTLEAAYFGVPVSFGPVRAHLFAETKDLILTGQGCKLLSAQDFQNFIALSQTLDAKQRMLWKTNIEGKLGTSQKVMEVILKVIDLKSEGVK